MLILGLFDAVFTRKTDEAVPNAVAEVDEFDEKHNQPSSSAETGSGKSDSMAA